MPPRFVAVAAAVVLALGACSPDDDAEDPADTGIEIPDVDAGPEDTGDDEDECTYQDDCEIGEYCRDGECREATDCSDRDDWQYCKSWFEGIDEDLSRRAYCGEDFCRIACLTDEHCPDGDVCSDNGQCIPFTGEITGEHPAGSGTDRLQAGVGSAPLNFPIGLSLGGYGSRAATNAGRYVESLKPSAGQMHELETRSVALDDGDRQLIFARTPLIFPSGALHERVARRLQNETGADWRSSLVISGTHTHSGPARFWQLPDPDETDVPMGMFGIDEYHEQALQWLADSIAEAALASLEDLEDARMGWEVVEQFDTDDVISSDRRSETPPFDDNRVLLIRIDDEDGQPKAVLTSFGTHGTVHSGPYANNDVMVGIEQQLERQLGETYESTVPVMYFNQNGGTMSPRGDRRDHEGPQRFDNLGAHLVDRTFETIETMETTDDWDFAGHTHRFPILHEYLEYADGQLDEAIYGGLQCTGDGVDGFDNHLAPDEYDCGLLAFHFILGHRPLTLISKSQISAFQLNDLTLVTMPGELSMPLGWKIQRELRDEYGIDPFDSFTLGYAQDHLLYLLPEKLGGEKPPFPGISTPKAPEEYPEYAFSYLQGGYEANMSPWGHRLGPFLVDRALEAVGLMRGEVQQPAHPVPLPDEFTERGHDEFPVEPTDPSDVGTITEGPADQVERRDPLEVAWIGGDPGAEMPQAPRATLQRQNDQGEFEPVELASHRPYDNREFTMLTRLRRDDQDRPEWVVYWEERDDFPTGTYRFHLQGEYLDADTDEPTGYETTTDPFDLVGSTAMDARDLRFEDARTVALRLVMPPATSPSLSGSGDDPGAPSGSYRMHHREVPSSLGLPVEGADIEQLDVQRDGQPVGVDDHQIVDDHEDIDGYDEVPVTRVTIELDESVETADTLEIDLRARDTHDNTADITTTLEYDP